MVRRKGVAAPKAIPPVKPKPKPSEHEAPTNLSEITDAFKECGEAEDIKPAIELALDYANARMNELVAKIERENVELRRILTLAIETLEKFDTAYDKLLTTNSELIDEREEGTDAIRDKAREILKKVPAVLGREDAIAEPISIFEFRRAAEDLEVLL